MGVDPDKKLIVEVDRELLNSDILNESRNSTNDNDVDDKRWAILWNCIATTMQNELWDVICLCASFSMNMFGRL